MGGFFRGWEIGDSTASVFFTVWYILSYFLSFSPTHIHSHIQNPSLHNCSNQLSKGEVGEGGTQLLHSYRRERRGEERRGGEAGRGRGGKTGGKRRRKIPPYFCEPSRHELSMRCEGEGEVGAEGRGELSPGF